MMKRLFALMVIGILIPVYTLASGLNGSKTSQPTSRDAFMTVGSIVTYGHYEQDNDLSNGQEPIEWIVLDFDAANNRALLISRYGLDAKPYNTTRDNVTWEQSTLHAWLNNDFLSAAFTASEQAGILVTNVDNSRSQGYSGWNTSGGNNTQDRIFLLSYAEANRYFGAQHNSAPDSWTNMHSRVAPTAYAIARGAGYSSIHITAEGIAAGWWWLRSPGDGHYCAALVNVDGGIWDIVVDITTVSVRPAFWLDLNAINP